MKNSNSLKWTAYAVTAIFVVLLLFPLLYMFTNSVKDNIQIYQVPPKLIPEAPKSLTVLVDYTKFDKLDGEELLDKLKKDTTVAMYSLAYEFNKQGIFEFRVYGLKNNLPIFYSRAHKMQLQLNMDYGVYAQMTVKKDLLLKDDGYRKSMDTIKYIYTPNQIREDFQSEEVGKNGLNDQVGIYLNDPKYKIEGDFKGTIISSNPLLLFENYKYYFMLPKMAYSRVTNAELIKKYSFVIFLFNTLLLVGWAIFSQAVFCSFTAFPLSKLFSKKVSDILLIFFLGTTMIPFVVIMVPQFVMFKSMGMYNNYAALLVPHLMPSGFYIFLYKGFFDRLPNSLFEAARIDGASEMYMFWNICMPLSKPIIALIALSTFLANWNGFFWEWMVSEKPQLWTLNVALYNLSHSPEIKQNFIMGFSFIMIIPILFVIILFSNQIKQTIATTGSKEG